LKNSVRFGVLILAVLVFMVIFVPAIPENNWGCAASHSDDSLSFVLTLGEVGASLLPSLPNSFDYYFAFYTPVTYCA